VATVAATWGDGMWLYSISPHAGIQVSDYQSQAFAKLQEAQHRYVKGEVSAAVLAQTTERTQRFMLDDFMRLVTSMLIDIKNMQSLVSSLLARVLLRCSALRSSQVSLPSWPHG
jgi:hypothetical protein